MQEKNSCFLSLFVKKIKKMSINVEYTVSFSVSSRKKIQRCINK